MPSQTVPLYLVWMKQTFTVIQNERLGLCAGATQPADEAAGATSEGE